MKNVTSLLISCSLVLAGAALAQQPNEQPTPKGKGAGKTHGAQAQPGANAAKPQEKPAKQPGAMKAKRYLSIVFAKKIAFALTSMLASAA